jgi:hypothetical protein
VQYHLQKNYTSLQILLQIFAVTLISAFHFSVSFLSSSLTSLKHLVGNCLVKDEKQKQWNQKQTTDKLDTSYEVVCSCHL